jgi:hypothetical protein
LLSLGFSSCGRGSTEIPLIPPPTAPLSRDCIGYGVVNAAFTQVLDEPEAGGNSLGYLRRGALVRVLDRRSAGKAGTRETWVLVEGAYRGWLRETADLIRVYDSEARAATASEALAR